MYAFTSRLVCAQLGLLEQQEAGFLGVILCWQFAGVHFPFYFHSLMIVCARWAGLSISVTADLLGFPRLTVL